LLANRFRSFVFLDSHFLSPRSCSVVLSFLFLVAFLTVSLTTLESGPKDPYKKALNVDVFDMLCYLYEKMDTRNSLDPIECHIQLLTPGSAVTFLRELLFSYLLLVSLSLNFLFLFYLLFVSPLVLLFFSGGGILFYQLSFGSYSIVSGDWLNPFQLCLSSIITLQTLRQSRKENTDDRTVLYDALKSSPDLLNKTTDEIIELLAQPYDSGFYAHEKGGTLLQYLMAENSTFDNNTLYAEVSLTVCVVPLSSYFSISIMS
jgi:hypothetical protein